MPIITLTTDFGSKDGFVGTLKGVIWKINPTIQIADISHEINPQNVYEGAMALWRAYPYFPPGTVHIAVVDPGVGTSRRPLAVHLGGHYFVGPDNGIFTPMYDDALVNKWNLEIVHLTKLKYFLEDVSTTFHGRDIFSPVAAYICSGVSLDHFGQTITDPVRISLPKPVSTSSGWQAHITVIDVFGNCTTDLPASMVTGSEDISFHVKGKEISGLATSYGHHVVGELIALVDSENFLEIAVVNGSAASVLGMHVGDIVEVIVGKPTTGEKNG